MQIAHDTAGRKMGEKSRLLPETFATCKIELVKKKRIMFQCLAVDMYLSLVLGPEPLDLKTRLLANTWVYTEGFLGSRYGGTLMVY